MASVYAEIQRVRSSQPGQVMGALGWRRVAVNQRRGSEKRKQLFVGNKEQETEKGKSCKGGGGRVVHVVTHLIFKIKRCI